MPKITDPEPIEDERGNILFENELDRVKQMYGFGSRYVGNSSVNQNELDERYFLRLKHKKNKAR